MDKNKSQKAEIYGEQTKSISNNLISLIINQDQLFLKWVNFLIISQGSALIAVWIILTREVNILNNTAIFKELIVIIVSIFVLFIAKFIIDIIIGELDNQGYFISKFYNLKGNKNKIWNEQLISKIEKNITDRRVGQGNIAKKCYNIWIVILCIWMIIIIAMASLLIMEICFSISILK